MMIFNEPNLSEGDLVAPSGLDVCLGVVITVLSEDYVIKTINFTQETHPFFAVKIYAPSLNIGDIVKHHVLSPAFERLQQEGFGEPLWEVVEITMHWVRVVPKTQLPVSSTFDTRLTRRYTWQASCFEIVTKA